jgi:hypothetical protein
MEYDPVQRAIRERAHAIWEHAGRPEGRALDHWLQAEREIRADAETAMGGLRVPMQRPEFEAPARG